MESVGSGVKDFQPGEDILWGSHLFKVSATLDTDCLTKSCAVCGTVEFWMQERSFCRTIKSPKNASLHKYTSVSFIANVMFGSFIYSRVVKKLLTLFSSLTRPFTGLVQVKLPIEPARVLLVFWLSRLQRSVWSGKFLSDSQVLAFTAIAVAMIYLYCF